ncbi:MAG: hypothetical protein JXQ73_15520 [Phycisphaerae bacterium]|nr:hypothetical protein [Phycisphaerae bacterium]
MTRYGVLVAAVSVALLAGTVGQAKADMSYSDPLTLNQNIYAYLGIGIPFTYAHSNPYESVGGYSAAEWLDAANNGLVTGVDLTLDFSGVGLAEWVKVEINAVGVGWTDLGTVLGDSPRTFDLLNPSYGLGPTGGLDGLPVEIRLGGFDGSGWMHLGATAMLDTSELSVTVATQPIPAPAAAMLVVVGLGTLGWVRRRSA